MEPKELIHEVRKLDKEVIQKRLREIEAEKKALMYLVRLKTRAEPGTEAFEIADEAE